MSTNFKRFNTSNSERNTSPATHEEGTLVWTSDNGIRLHDGETPDGNPLLSIHYPQSILATVTYTNGTDMVTVAGNETGQWWAGINGEDISFTSDDFETKYKISTKTYDTGTNVTLFTFTPAFNGPVTVGSNMYTGVYKNNVDRLVAGDGITLSQIGSIVFVQKQFSGQQEITLDANTLSTGYTMSNLTSALIVVNNDPAYSNSGETHNITLPFDTLTVKPAIPLGTRITIINQSPNTASISGWPGPGMDILPSGSINFIYYYDADYPGNLWWVTDTFNW